MRWIAAILVSFLAISDARTDAKTDSYLDIIKSTIKVNCKNVVKWSVKGNQGKYNEKDNAFIPQQLNPLLYYNNTVHYDPVHEKVHASFESVQPWIQGLDPYIWSESVLVADGKSVSHWQRTNPGATPPEPRPRKSLGSIGPYEKRDFLKRYGTKTGIGHFPPNAFNVDLVDFLESKNKAREIVSLIENQGLLEIITTPPQDVLKTESYFKIYYDPKNGIPLKAEYIALPSLKKNANKVWSKIDIVWEKIEDQFVPRRVLEYSLLDNQATEMVFQDLEILKNQPVSFGAMEFPVGTRVDDNLAKISYTVSPGIDGEQKAIREFIETHELRENENGKPNSYLYLYLGVGALVTILLVFFVKKRFFLVGFAATLVGLGGAPGEARAVDRDDQGNWIHQPRGIKSHRVSQCGYNVTVFALEYFRVVYDNQFVASCLPPGPEGIRFLDIKRTLEAHDLNVVAKKQVSFDQLKTSLHGGNLALFPIKYNDYMNHYLVASVLKGKKVIFDVPVKITDIDHGFDTAPFDALDGTVLFVSKKTYTSSGKQSELVAFDRDRADLGRIAVGSPDEAEVRKVSFRVRNTSGQTLGVAKVTAACGCTRTDKSGFLLPPGAHKDLEVIPILGSWPPGPSTKPVVLSFTDGSTASVFLSAELLPAETVQGILLDTKILVSKLPVDYREKRLKYKVGFTLPQDSLKPSDIRVATKEPWLSATITATGPGRGSLDLEFSGKDLPKDEDSILTEVRLTGSGNGAPVKVELKIEKPHWYRLTDPIAKGHPGESLTITGKTLAPYRSFTLSPRQSAKNLWQPERIQSLPASETGAFTVKFFIPKSVEPGFYALRINFDCDSVERQMVIPIHLSK